MWLQSGLRGGCTSRFMDTKSYRRIPLGPAAKPSDLICAQRKLKWTSLIICLAVSLTVFVAFTGWFGFELARTAWQHPPLLVVFVLCAILFIFVLRRQHRTEGNEIRRFEQRPPNEDQDFLSEIGVHPDSPEAQAALISRKVFAELGGVPAHSLRASDRFYPDMGKLPFYDSIDSLEIVLTLEQQLNIKLSHEDEDRILSHVHEKLAARRTPIQGSGSATVGDAVREILTIWSRQIQASPKGPDQTGQP